MALNAIELELYEIGRRSLPSWYAPHEAINEQLAAKAKIHGQSSALDEYWLQDQAFIMESDGATIDTPDWLGQHALDRGTSRQASETDEALRTRIRNIEEGLHPGAILAAAQGILVAAGITGMVSIIELPRSESFFVNNQPQAGTGGSFASTSGGRKFTPMAGWANGAPPFRSPSRSPIIGYRLTISGASAPGNNGVFAVTGIESNAARFSNGSGTDSNDASVLWRVDRIWNDGAVMTEGSGFDDVYFDRGYRMGGNGPVIVIVLPFGTTEGVRLSVLEMLRLKKAAGVMAIVERRLVL